VTTATPPAWAQALLALVTPLRHRDGIAGDFLEEYHDVQIPRRGEAGADAWYLRQVLMFLWRAARWWGLALGAILVIRDAIDIYVPTHDYYVRSAWTTYTAMSIYAVCGARAGWCYGRVLSGTLIGITTGVIASIIGVVAPLLFMGVLVVRHTNAYDGLWEALDVPVPVILAFGAVLGSLGAAIGQGANHFRLRTAD
jgi:hypothetical protein